MIRLRQPFGLGGIVIAFVLAWASPFSFARSETPFDPAIRPQFREPVALASKDGVLEVRLTARQGRPGSIRWPLPSRTSCCSTMS